MAKKESHIVSATISCGNCGGFTLLEETNFYAHTSECDLCGTHGTIELEIPYQKKCEHCNKIIDNIVVREW